MQEYPLNQVQHSVPMPWFWQLSALPIARRERAASLQKLHTEPANSRFQLHSNVRGKVIWSIGWKDLPVSRLTKNSDRL